MRKILFSLLIIGMFGTAASIAKDRLSGTVVAEKDGRRVITNESTPDSTTNYVVWTTSTGQRQHLTILCEVWNSWDHCIELTKGETYPARFEIGKNIIVKITAGARVGNFSRPVEFKSKVIDTKTE